jgi:hypothetical protein
MTLSAATELAITILYCRWACDNTGVNSRSLSLGITQAAYSWLLEFSGVSRQRDDWRVGNTT